MDGQPSLWTAAERLPEQRIEILDLLHATPRIWDASKLFYTKHEEKLKFIEDRVLRILQADSIKRTLVLSYDIGIYAMIVDDLNDKAQ